MSPYPYLERTATLMAELREIERELAGVQKRKARIEMELARRKLMEMEKK